MWVDVGGCGYVWVCGINTVYIKFADYMYSVCRQYTTISSSYLFCSSPFPPHPFLLTLPPFLFSSSSPPPPQVALVYGQMNEPPGARARVALTGLTVAEYFRDQEGQDVLLFIDNIFRFTQAGSEVCVCLCLCVCVAMLLHR